MSRFVSLRASLCVAFSLCATQAIYPQAQSAPCSPPSATADVVQHSGEDQQSLSSTKYITVDEITFRGQSELPPGELKVIAKDLTERRYEDNPQWLEEVRERVRDAWQHRGYFWVQASATDVAEGTADKTARHVALSITVDAGRQYYLREIDFRNVTQFSSAELRAMFPIQDGAVFDTHQLQDGLENLRKSYGAKGYIDFSAVPSFENDEGNNLITTVVEFDEGKAYRIGQVTILGLLPSITEQLRESSDLQSGKIFDTSLMQRFFDQNRALLPDGADDGLAKHLNEQQGTVDLVMDFRKCPVITQR